MYSCGFIVDDVINLNLIGFSSLNIARNDIHLWID